MRSNQQKLIGFGCVKLSACRFEHEAIAQLKTAYDAGIRWFDTAPLYGQGYSEILLGKFLKSLSSQERDDVLVTTKFGLGPVASPKLPSALALPLNLLKKTWTSREGQNLQTKRKLAQTPEIIKKPNRRIDIDMIRHQFRNSLHHLGISKIHSYLGHELLPTFLTEEAIQYLYELKNSGRIHTLGIGIAAHHILAEEEDSLNGFDILQYNGDYAEHGHLLMSRFPDKTHVHHSILASNGADNDSASKKLQIHRKTFPTSVILFSSSNPDNIRRNVQDLATNHAIY